jgi:hypothetical protein
MSFEMKGFDKVIKKLGELEKKVGEYEKGKEVPIEALLNGSFMSKYTKFSSFDEMIAAHPYQGQWTDIPNEEWDEYVKETTSFSSWDEMLSKAGEIYLAKQLKF